LLRPWASSGLFADPIKERHACACKVSGTKVSGTDEVAPSSIFERVFIRHAGGYAIANPRRLKPSGGAYYRPRKFRGSFMVDFVRRRSWYSRTNQDGQIRTDGNDPKAKANVRTAPGGIGACYGSNISVGCVSSAPPFLGRPRFCADKLRWVARSREPMNSLVPRGRPV
jgi:hypothetical protein